MPSLLDIRPRAITPNQYVNRIASSDEYRKVIGRQPEANKRSLLSRCAAHLAIRMSHEQGHDSLDTHLFRLISQVSVYADNDHKRRQMREKYGDKMRMNSFERNRFDRTRNAALAFNDSLRDVIRTGSHRFTFDGLANFVAGVYSGSGASFRDARELRKHVETDIIGARNEYNFGLLLTRLGYAWEKGSKEEDRHGGDFIINGIPVDVKSSQFGVERALQREHASGYDDETIIWSHIHNDDYKNGALTLDQEAIARVAEDLRPELEAMVGPAETYTEAA